MRTHLLPPLGLAVALCLVAGGCGGPQAEPGGSSVELGKGSPSPTATQTAEPKAVKVDPRKGGFEIGFGEFAVTLEARAIRPGPVTFVVNNGGKLVHGFEMEAEGVDEDHSGPGGGGDDHGFKIEKPTFGPGDTIRIPLDLAPGVYKIECYVANHSDLGMEILLEVRPGAPFVQAPQGAGAGDQIAIEGFAFDPDSTEVSTGTEVTWTNADPTAHTVTADDDSFDSGPVDPGKTFSVTFDESGTVSYFCAIHPTMKGKVRVTG